MSEIMKQGEIASPQIEGEALKALIEKVVNNGKEIRQNSEDIRKLSEQGVVLQGLDKQVGTMGQYVDKLGKKFGEVAEGLRNVKEQTAFPVGVIDGLRMSLGQHARLFEKPLEKSVHVKYFLGRPILVLSGVIVVILSLVFLWNGAVERAGQYTENDIKWRCMKLTHDSLVLNALSQADEDYQSNPKQFEKDVTAEEERRRLLFEKWLQVNEKYGEIRDLQGKEKKK